MDFTRVGVGVGCKVGATVYSGRFVPAGVGLGVGEEVAVGVGLAVADGSAMVAVGEAVGGF